jgi:hypothetical protein
MIPLLKGRAPKPGEIPSASTIRTNATRLNNIDDYELTQKYARLAKDLSPCGNKRVFGIISDGTKHGGHDAVQVVILTCDESGDVTNRQDTSLTLEQRYYIDPFFVLATTSPSVESNWDGNSELNIDMIHKFVPNIAKGRFGFMGTDNCPDAKKERRETGKKFINHLREQNLHSATHQNGVEKRLKCLGDGFHVDQLGNKKLSEGACGKTDGEFDQNQHRQVSYIID